MLPFVATLSGRSNVRAWRGGQGEPFNAASPPSKEENKELPFLPLFFGPSKEALSPVCILRKKIKKQMREIKVRPFVSGQGSYPNLAIIPRLRRNTIVAIEQ